MIIWQAVWNQELFAKLKERGQNNGCAHTLNEKHFRFVMNVIQALTIHTPLFFQVLFVNNV